MPLIVMCGYPASGKSTLTKELEKYFREDRGKIVTVITEEELMREHKNLILDDSRKEKEVRAKLKSEGQRCLSKDNIVILDALNYIKGYRYELYCMSKAVPTRQAIVQCDVSENQAWEWNLTRGIDEQYSKDVFDHLVQRFEAPDPMNRWDSPLFSVLAGERLDFNKLFQSLFEVKPPKQNLSTQSKPVSDGNYIHSLERLTSEIIQVILTKRSAAESEEEIIVPHTSVCVQISSSYTNTSLKVNLTKLKRQFITLTKTSGLQGNPGDLFVQYLNSQLQNKSPD